MLKTRSRLKWSKKPPAKKGWYMFRRAAGATAVPARVFDQGRELKIQFWADAGWFDISYPMGEFAFVCK